MFQKKKLFGGPYIRLKQYYNGELLSHNFSYKGYLKYELYCHSRREKNAALDITRIKIKKKLNFNLLMLISQKFSTL